MCACRQKKSFFIEDILQDVKKKPYKNLSNEPTKPLTCTGATPPPNDVDDRKQQEKTTKFNVICEVQKEMEMNKINLDQRRNTYPLYPTPIKANIPWPQYRGKETVGYVEQRPFTYYSDPMLNTNQILRNQLAANRFIAHPFAVRQAYGFDRGLPAISFRQFLHELEFNYGENTWNLELCRRYDMKAAKELEEAEGIFIPTLTWITA